MWLSLTLLGYYFFHLFLLYLLSLSLASPLVCQITVSHRDFQATLCRLTSKSWWITWLWYIDLWYKHIFNFLLYLLLLLPVYAFFPFAFFFHRCSIIIELGVYCILFLSYSCVYYSSSIWFGLVSVWTWFYDFDHFHDIFINLWDFNYLVVVWIVCLIRFVWWEICHNKEESIVMIWFWISVHVQFDVVDVVDLMPRILTCSNRNCNIMQIIDIERVSDDLLAGPFLLVT